MNSQALNKICFSICIVCIVIGVMISLVMIWTPGINEVMWRCLGTVGIVFLGAAATLSVSKAFGGRSLDTSRSE